jgi:hypothetical protein
MIGGSIGKVGNIYTVSARVIDVETGEVLKSANYDHIGDIGQLLIKGMKEVAHELLVLKLKKENNSSHQNNPNYEEIIKEVRTNKNTRQNTSDIGKKKHSIGIGIGTNKTFNLIQYTYDLKLSESFSLYGLIGYANLFGLGVAWQQNYNDNGLMLGWSRGVDVDESAFGSIALSYQWRLGQNPTFLSLGLFIWSKGNMNLWMMPLGTVILSIDRRFGF